MKATAVALKGACVAVTGAARGIGLATARAFVAKGANVVIGDIDIELARKEANRIGAVAVLLDVRSADSIERFFEAVEARYGQVDVLVNNAGIMPLGAFLEEPAALSEAQIDINLRGVIHGCRRALPSMLRRSQGHIVNVASLAGRFAIPGASVYCATKFAVIGFTEALAGEHRNSGVNFTVVMPSKVKTELSSGTDAADAGIPAVTPEQVARAIVKSVQSPRLFVAVPDYLRHAHGLFGGLPVWLQQKGRQLLGDDAVLTRIDHRQRATYEARLAALTTEQEEAPAAIASRLTSDIRRTAELTSERLTKRLVKTAEQVKRVIDK